MIESEAHIRSFSHLENAVVGSGAEVGPYARLRPGTVLEPSSKVGNFVELKNTKLGQLAKVNHLAYVGDSEVGASANIGAGTITCNYDGSEKASNFDWSWSVCRLELNFSSTRRYR